MAGLFPLIPDSTRRALKARWSRQLLEILGVRLLFAGSPPTGGLLVANHISWLDIYAINALAPTAFVAKDDLLAWPVIGWLSRQTETIFLERGSRRAAMSIKSELVARLYQGACVGVFPEGTTSSGESVLHFHSALFQSVIDAEAHVLPTVVRYTDKAGQPSAAPAYAGATSLWQSLLAVANADSLTAYLDFMPATPAVGMTRRQLSEATRQLIASRLTRPPGGILTTYGQAAKIQAFAEAAKTEA